MHKISSKDLDALSDLLTYEGSICKKFDDFSQDFTDPQLQALSRGIAERHRMRFETLFQFLNDSKN